MDNNNEKQNDSNNTQITPETSVPNVPVPDPNNDPTPLQEKNLNPVIAQPGGPIRKKNIFDKQNRVQTIIIGLLIVAVLTLLIILALGKNETNTDPANKQDTTSANNSVNKAETSSIQQQEKVTNITWLDQPTEYKQTPGLIAPTHDCFTLVILNPHYICDYTIYKLGDSDQGEILILNVEDVPGFTHYIVINNNNKYIIPIKNNAAHVDDTDGKFWRGPLDSSIETSDTTTIAELLVKDQISYGGITANSTGGLTLYDGYSQDELNKIATEVAVIDEGTVYEKVKPKDNGVKLFNIILKTPSGLFTPYRYTTEVLNDDDSVNISWNDGSSTSDTYIWASGSGGCSVTESVTVLDKNEFSHLVKSGTSNGQTIYTFDSIDNQVIGGYYEDYSAYRDDAISKQEFFNDNAVIAVRNELGYRVLMVKDKYQHAGECGKPVIYLYPEEETEISVQVGADITTSEPEYRNGWTVTASPDGTLKNRDGEYDSLFWEGLGHGQYPEINKGFIVKSSAIESTLKTHLEMQGLNPKEISDFLEFWLPLMPKEPYTRLTWFTTEEMNQLAPLRISQKPDTLIRVFLDFQGIKTPYPLKKQTLSHPPRNGFTVVEWGGLLTK